MGRRRPSSHMRSPSKNMGLRFRTGRRTVGDRNCVGRVEQVESYNTHSIQNTTANRAIREKAATARTGQWTRDAARRCRGRSVNLAEAATQVISRTHAPPHVSRAEPTEIPVLPWIPRPIGPHNPPQAKDEP